jgi:hypothetical protein
VQHEQPFGRSDLDSIGLSTFVTKVKWRPTRQVAAAPAAVAWRVKGIAALRA